LKIHFYHFIQKLSAIFDLTGTIYRLAIMIFQITKDTIFPLQNLIFPFLPAFQRLSLASRLDFAAHFNMNFGKPLSKALNNIHLKSIEFFISIQYLRIKELS